IARGSSTARLLHFMELSSFTQIMNSLTVVLNEKLLISCSTFLMVLCRIFNSSRVGSALLTFQLPCASWNRFQNLRKNLNTPSMPLVFQGLLNSSGPRNISYKHSVSAP